MAARAASASLRAASLRAAAAASSSRRFKRAAALAASFSALRAFDSARFALFGPFVLGADTDASFSSLGDPAVLSSRLARAGAGVFGVFGAFGESFSSAPSSQIEKCVQRLWRKSKLFFTNVLSTFGSE